MNAGMSAFNKAASEKFKGLTDEAKSKLADVAASGRDQSLTETQVVKKITDIFGKLRDKTVIEHIMNGNEAHTPT